MVCCPSSPLHTALYSIYLPSKHHNLCFVDLFLWFASFWKEEHCITCDCVPHTLSTWVHTASVSSFLYTMPAFIPGVIPSNHYASTVPSYTYLPWEHFLYMPACRHIHFHSTPIRLPILILCILFPLTMHAIYTGELFVCWVVVEENLFSLWAVPHPHSFRQSDL